MAATNIYEVVNRPRRESLIAICADPPGMFRLRLRARPQPVAHWRLDEELEIERIAAEMPVADAEEFLAQYVESARSDGWRLIPWRC